MKKICLKICFLILIFVVAFSTFKYSFAIGASEILGELSTMENVKNPDESGTNVQNSINQVIGVIQVAGTGIALAMISLLGVKYMLAAPSEKADAKKQIMPLLIGCILLFGAVNVTKYIFILANTSFGN